MVNTSTNEWDSVLTRYVPSSMSMCETQRWVWLRYRPWVPELPSLPTTFEEAEQTS